MNKTDWMKHYGLTEFEMLNLEAWLLGVNGTIVAVFNETFKSSYNKYMMKFYNQN